MPTIGTPFSPTATKVALCGSGELGKEVVIELQRFGCEVIAIDRYANAPAMQVADAFEVVGDHVDELVAVRSEVLGCHLGNRIGRPLLETRASALEGFVEPGRAAAHQDRVAVGALVHCSN